MISIKFKVSRSAATSVVLAGLLAFGSQIADAATTTTAKVLCVQKSGVVIGRSTCKTGETRFATTAGNLSRKAKTAKTLTGNSSAPLSAQPMSATFATTVSSLSILTATPRMYTSLVTVPSGTEFDTEFFNTPEMPKCPSDAPLMLNAWPVAVNDGVENAVVWSDSELGSYGQKLPEPIITDEYVIENYWNVNAQTEQAPESQNKTFRIWLERDARVFEGTSLPRAVKFYLTIMCVPTVDYIPAA